MSNYERAIFISYAWGGENENIVNQFDDVLQKRGLKVVRDKRNLEYKGSISKFMERIGRGDCIIVVISDKYLKSPNCMFELVEIAGNKNFENRIFPIVLADADIYKFKGQMQYIKHWEDQIKDLKEGLKDLDPTNLQGIYEQLNLYDRIRDNISKLTAILGDMNTLTPDMHKESDFSALYDAIVERMGGVMPTPGQTNVEEMALDDWNKTKINTSGLKDWFQSKFKG
jgi:internalin A